MVSCRQGIQQVNHPDYDKPFKKKLPRGSNIKAIYKLELLVLKDVTINAYTTKMNQSMKSSHASLQGRALHTT